MHAAKLPTNRLDNPLNSRSDQYTIAVKFGEKRKKWSTALIKLAIDRTKADSHITYSNQKAQMSQSTIDLFYGLSLNPLFSSPPQILLEF